MNLRTILVVLYGLFLPFISYSQNTNVIKGYVNDSEGALAGVTVWIVGSKVGTTTNFEGYYELKKTSHSQPTISFSFIGKKTVKKAYKGENLFNISLEDDLLSLGEVLITAKPNINEIDLRAKTGSVDIVPVAKLKNTPVSSITMALQGKTPGLQIINRGELGTLPQIRIRGNSSLRRDDATNQPLYILDGKMIPPETFFYLNPEDIEEMKVLKDAVASALYGIKAANGVIEITSKRGGEKSLNYHTQVGLTFVTPLRVKMMNSSEKLQLEELLMNEATPGYRYSKKYIQKKYGDTPLAQEKWKEGQVILDSLRNINTDWHKELARMQSFQKHDISYRNGTENTSYLVSLGYLHQGGQLDGNDLSRLSSRISIDQTLATNAIATLSVTGAYAKTKTPNGLTFSPEELIYKLNPYETKQSAKLYSYPTRSFNDLFNQFSQENTTKNIGSSFSINWKPSSSLEISAVTGFDYTIGESLEITPANAISEIRSGRPENARGTLKQSKNTITNLTSNIRVNYNKVWGKHDFTLGANADNYTTIIDNINILGHGLYGNMRSGSAIDNSLSGTGRSIVGAKKQTDRNLGMGALIGYTYNKIYDLFATYKIDASSVLPKSKRWNSAWAIGTSIDIKAYKFMQDISWISSLKLRGSYGQTANAQGISPSLTIATFRYLPKSYNNIRLMEIMALPNKELRAEQNKIIDVGLSMSVRRTNISFSVYQRTTEDALLSIPIASSSGFRYQLQNIGILENRGIEFGINHQFLFSDNKWSVRVGGNMSYNENKVLDLYDKQRIYIGDNILPEYEVGKSTDVLYGLRSTGINPITGIPDFINHKGEQVSAYTTMTREDYVSLGKSTPPFNGSFYANVGYRRFQVEMDFYYSLGGIKQYSNTYIRDADQANFNASKSQLTDMWWNVGDDNKKYHTPFVNYFYNQNLSAPNDKTVVKTDFLRFSNLSVKYQFDVNQIQHFTDKIRYITLGINASNLAIFSNYKDSNPETSNIVNPLPPTITLNLNVTF